MMLAEAARCKSAFVTNEGFWEYLRVPFGLRNAPAWFMRVIGRMLADEKLLGSRAFVDDLVTGGHSFKQYADRQVQLLATLRDKRWLVSEDKARLGYRKLKLLGNLIEKGNIYPDENKVAAFKRLLPPQNIKQLRAFLGLGGFYRKFIEGFASIVHPLFELLKEKNPFEWGAVQEQAFTALKEALSSTFWLAAPTPTGRFRVYTDFSQIAFGAALHQL